MCLAANRKSGHSIRLVENRKSGHSIIIPAESGEAGRFAAEELAKYLYAISGARLSISDDTLPPRDKEICIGRTNRKGTPDGSDLQHDGYRLLSSGDNVFILGQNARGNLYGVYGLLEHKLGCRFFAPGVEHLPKREVLQLDSLDEKHVSPFEYREAFWHTCFDPDMTMKYGYNGLTYELDARYADGGRHKPLQPRHGGGITYHGFVHTFKVYLPHAEWYPTHPEYYALVDGKRMDAEDAQLCLTNPDVLALIIERLRANIRTHPDATIFSLSQNDAMHPCTCPSCAAIDEEEGSHSGSLLRFVNACADAVAEEYPHVLIDTLAYLYTRKAPNKTRPAPNVCVRLCSIECCYAHPISECRDVGLAFAGTVPGQTSFKEDLEAWSAICDRLFIWDYTTNYRHYLAPMPNLRVLGRNMRFFAKNHVTGVFEQGNGESVSGEFGELRAWLLGKLMWNPALDTDTAMDEFLHGYYGLSAGPIRRYIDLWLDDAQARLHCGIFDHPTSDRYPEWLMNEANALWDEAEKLADDDAVLGRVQRSRLQLRYVSLWQTPPDASGREKALESFKRDVRSFGIRHLREWQTLDQGFSLLEEDLEKRTVW